MQPDEIVAAQKQNEKIKLDNNICCDRKAYFFGYVYPAKMAEFRAYNKEQKMLCRKVFDIELSQLKQKQDKTQEEKLFLRNYYKYAPLFNSNSSMNVLARYIEDFEFHKNTQEQYFDYGVLMAEPNRDFQKNVCEQIKRILKQFEYQFALMTKHKQYMLEHFGTNANLPEINTFDVLLENTKIELIKTLSNEEELVDYLVYIYYNYYKSGNRTLLWQVFADQMVKNVKHNSINTYSLVEDETGIEIFGRKFILKEGEFNGN